MGELTVQDEQWIEEQLEKEEERLTSKQRNGWKKHLKRMLVNI